MTHTVHSLLRVVLGEKAFMVYRMVEKSLDELHAIGKPIEKVVT